MVLQNYIVVASLVIISVIIGLHRRPFNLLSPSAEEVDLFVVENLSLLIVSQEGHKVFQGPCRSYRELNLFLELSLRLPNLRCLSSLSVFASVSDLRVRLGDLVLGRERHRYLHALLY